MARHAGMFVLALLTACNPFGSSEDVVCAETTPPADGAETATIGQLEQEQFVDVADNQSYPMHHGLQGGQHIDVSVRFFGTDGSKWKHDLLVTDMGSGVELGRTQIEVDACVPGWTETHYIRVVLDEEGSRDARIRCVVSRLDGDGEIVRSLEGEYTIKIVDDG